MSANQSKTDNFPQLPEPQDPLLLQPLGTPLSLEQLLHPISN
jgi:hypothetical protein